MGQRLKRRICVFTGSRADYGPLVPLIRRLHEDEEIDLKLLVSGGHLVPDQGMTVEAIEADGFVVDERVDMVLAGDSPSATSKSFALGCVGYGDALDRLDPDILVVLGDRYEVLAAAVAALPRLIPVAHIGGGQLTFGSTDDQMRHAITKLSHLHYTVTAEDRRRVINMGEEPARVFKVGMVGLDPSLLDDLMSREALQNTLELELRSPVFAVTHHPATADPDDARRSFHGLLEALDRFPQATLVLTAPNVDSGSRAIGERLRHYAETRTNATFVPSLGQRRYLSLLKYADLVVGNSSSGINEAPALGAHTVNIGKRQDGRSRPPTVIDCDEDAAQIATAIAKAMSLKQRGERRATVGADVGQSLSRIVTILKDVDLDRLLRKRFFERNGLA